MNDMSRWLRQHAGKFWRESLAVAWMILVLWQLTMLRSDIASIRQHVRSMESNVSSIQTDVSSMESNVSSMESDLSYVRINGVQIER